MFWAKYATGTTFEFPMIKRGAVDFAQNGDWTPASTDAAISKDNGSLADTTNTVAIVGGSPTRGASLWKLALTGTELTAAECTVQIVDAATKVVEDQSFTVYTYGHASAKFAGDWSDLVRLGLTSLPNANAEAAGGLYTRGTGAGQIAQDANGRIDANIKSAAGTNATLDTNNVLNVSTKYVGGTLQTAGDLAALLATLAGYVDTEVAAIKAKTDQLTFTVGNQVDANALTIATAMRAGIRKNTAIAAFEILMTDSTTHNPATGLSDLAITRSIDGAGFGVGTIANITEIANGWYKFDFGAGDLNGTVIGVRATATGADDLAFTIKTSP